jgi:hypothetical protein
MHVYIYNNIFFKKFISINHLHHSFLFDPVSLLFAVIDAVLHKVESYLDHNIVVLFLTTYL